jgi:signal transduction histidine kinase
LGFAPKAGDDLLKFTRPEWRETVKAHIEDAFCNRVCDFETNYPQNGMEFWLELGFYPMPDDHGITTHVCLRAKNITEKKSLSHKLDKQTKEQKNSVIKATLDAQERERSEIGRELHDNVNQVLTTVKLYNEICLTEEATNKVLLQKSIQQINYCIETIRSLSKTLSSPNIEEITLKDSIRELVDSINSTGKLVINFYSYGIKDEKISQELQTGLFRIAQEQLTNVLKYANASYVDLLLVGTITSVALRIQDNGDGFDFNQKRKGVGITNMISRAESLGGMVEFETGPGKGCSLMVEIPVA